jgi:hypothetical protein
MSNGWVEDLTPWLKKINVVVKGQLKEIKSLYNGINALSNG